MDASAEIHTRIGRRFARSEARERAGRHRAARVRCPAADSHPTASDGAYRNPLHPTLSTFPDAPAADEV
jgi:hypothetical protein